MNYPNFNHIAYTSGEMFFAFLCQSIYTHMFFFSFITRNKQRTIENKTKYKIGMDFRSFSMSRFCYPIKKNAIDMNEINDVVLMLVVMVVVVMVMMNVGVNFLNFRIDYSQSNRTDQLFDFICVFVVCVCVFKYN